MKNAEIKINPSYYAIIPADVRYSDAPPNAKLLYGEITALCNEKGFCWATNSYFSQLYKVAPTTVSEWVSFLVKLGFLTVEITDKTHRKIYLTLREKPKGVPQKAEGYPSGKAEDNNTSSNTKLNTSGVVFENFWQLYPKKVEKKKAEAKWNRLKKSDQDIILADLLRRTKTEQWLKNNGQFVPNPCTYLNGERWNDVLPETTAISPGRSSENWTEKRVAEEREQERQRAKDNRIQADRAAIDSPARLKFNQLKDKFKIGKTI